MNKRQKKKLDKRYGFKKYRDYKRYLANRELLQEAINIWEEHCMDPILKYIIEYNGCQYESRTDEVLQKEKNYDEI